MAKVKKSAWIDQIFDAKNAKKPGAVLRRQKTSVEKYASVEQLKTEVRQRGHHLIETDNQFLILMHLPGYQHHF